MARVVYWFTAVCCCAVPACGSSVKTKAHGPRDAASDTAAPDASTVDGPAATNDGWPVSTAAAEGLDATVLLELEQAIDNGDYVTPDALLVARHGKLVYERYWNGWRTDRLHDLRSATKSVTSALVGIAVARGDLDDVQSKALPFFAGAEPFRNTDERKGNITIEHLLTMSSGLACDDWVPASEGNEEKMYLTQDWVRFILDLPMAREPGAASAYCTGGVVVLGAILHKATGVDVPTFAREHLFAPLGIKKAEWESTPSGDTDTGGHLMLRARDFAKFAQLFLNRGTWDGKQILSASWVAQSAEDRYPMADSRYGYLWWINAYELNGIKVPVTFARGNGGQYAFVMPSLDMVAVFLGSDYNGPGSAEPLEIAGRYLARAALSKPAP